MKPMGQIFSIGDRIGGYCNGYFGRDDYENKQCVMISTKFAVFEYEDGQAAVINNREGLEECVQQWKDDYDGEYS